MAGKLICIIISVLFVGMAAVPCEAREAGGHEEKPREQRKNDAKPFDRNIVRLPPGYLGNDIVPVYERLAKEAPSKTDLPYLRGLLAFVCGQPTQDDAKKETRASYNPKKQIMSVTFLPLTGRSAPMAHRSIVLFKEVKVLEEKPEKGQASGSKAVVKTYHEEHYGVASDDTLHLSTDIDFSMSPEEARESKDHIGVLLVCVAKPMGDPPVYSFLESSLSATPMVSDSETFYFQHFVGVELLEIWIFNRETGAIYVKSRWSDRNR